MVLTHLASYLHDSVAFVATPVGEAATVEELKEDMVAIHDHLLAVLEMVHIRLEEVEVQIRTPNDAVLLRTSSMLMPNGISKSAGPRCRLRGARSTTSSRRAGGQPTSPPWLGLQPAPPLLLANWISKSSPSSLSGKASYRFI